MSRRALPRLRACPRCGVKKRIRNPSGPCGECAQGGDRNPNLTREPDIALANAQAPDRLVPLAAERIIAEWLKW